MAEYSEHDVEKVSAQTLVHDPTFVDPADDDNAPEGFLLAVWCDAPPNDGDVAVYVADNSRFELQPQSSLTPAAPVTASDGMGGFAIVFAEDGTVVYSS